MKQEFDQTRLEEQKKLLRGGQKGVDFKFHALPFTDYVQAGSRTRQEAGWQRIARGEVGCLVVAGGQGSRLQFDGPKGAFPIKGKNTTTTLFQHLAEKVAEASQQAQRPLPLAIMTSPINHKQTQEFFAEHRFFGLSSEQVSFFMQGMLPLLDENGSVFLESRTEIAKGPDGNGKALQHFYESGIWKQWSDRGVRFLNFIQIDNALADPYNAELVGYHAEIGADATLQCIPREDPDEKVGVVVQSGSGRTARVVEYTEIPEQEQRARLEDGSLKYFLANISIFCFSMDFVQRVGENTHKHMPLHLAHKAVKALNDAGETMLSDKPNAWKFEYFIFDVLSEARKTGVLLCPRERCFAPLKNATGVDSPETVWRYL